MYEIKDIEKIFLVCVDDNDEMSPPVLSGLITREHRKLLVRIGVYEWLFMKGHSVLNKEAFESIQKALVSMVNRPLEYVGAQEGVTSWKDFDDVFSLLYKLNTLIYRSEELLVVKSK